MFEPGSQMESHLHQNKKKAPIKSNLKRNSNKENYHYYNENNMQFHAKIDQSSSSSSATNQLSHRDGHHSKLLNNRKTENFYLAYKETKRDHSKKSKKLSELKSNVPLWRREDDSIIIKRFDKMDMPKEKKADDPNKNINKDKPQTSPTTKLNVHRLDRFKGKLMIFPK